MTLRSDMAAALPGAFEAEGEEALFSPAVGDAVACHVFIDYNCLLQPAGAEGQTWRAGTVIEALISEIGREPKRGETFTVGGTEYIVESVAENDGISVRVQVT